MSERQPHDLLDEVIHQRTRLAIMSTLAGVESLDFNELKVHLNLTDGNLSKHLTALEEASYVKITKAFVGKRPRTTAEVTPKGLRAMENYINMLQAVLKKDIK